jgi:hypothetical protein
VGEARGACFSCPSCPETNEPALSRRVHEAATIYSSLPTGASRVPGDPDRVLDRVSSGPFEAAPTRLGGNPRISNDALGRFGGILFWRSSCRCRVATWTSAYGRMRVAPDRSFSLAGHTRASSESAESPTCVSFGARMCRLPARRGIWAHSLGCICQP